MAGKVKSTGSMAKVSGGKSSMMKRQFTGTQKPGVSSQEHSKSGGMAKGGTTKMFGKQTVKPLRPA
mgnify:CR=1 FL=1